MFKPPIMIGIYRFDPPLQFIHEDDLMRLIEIFLVDKMEGIYNVAGDGEIKYSDVAKLLRKRMLKLPERLLEFLMLISWVMHLQTDSPASGLKFIKYPPVVSTDKLVKYIGFRFQYSTKEALSSLVSALRNR